MLLNEHVVVTSHSVHLYPYDAVHVSHYHTWMSDPAMLQLTASEPLTIDEEHAMQQAWRHDADKLTFIVVLPSDEYSLQSSTSRMIGDVNLFLHRLDRDDDATQESNEPDVRKSEKYSGELEIMIAESSARRHGYGRAALLLFMAYILTHAQQITVGTLFALTVKIGHDNAPSLALFQSVGFVKVKYSEYFKEWELSCSIDEKTIQIVTELMRPEDRNWQERCLDS